MFIGMIYLYIMAELEQIIAQIRFQLEQLTYKNAHHEFEHLCRHLTRSRICSNVLPATGPVSAGGDQGRDFETFRTYLASSLIAKSSFIGLIRSNPVAFTCSIQKENINNKIKSDVETVMGSGTKVDDVYFFSTTSISVSTRHDLQQWAKDNYQIHLEILDGEAISELLSDRDVFWIAESYLKIPGEIYPRPLVDQEQAWYQEMLIHWTDEVNTPENYADYSDIRVAARFALFDQELINDIPFWLKLLQYLILSEQNPLLKRKAIYEHAVISMRGLGNIEGEEDNVRFYFSIIASLIDPNDMKDVAALLNYCLYAVRMNRTSLTIDEVREWYRELIQLVEEQLSERENLNTKCQLLDIRGYLCLWNDPLTEKLNFNEALVWWNKLIDLVDGAPLFPLEDFVDNLTMFLEIGEVSQEYLDLTQQVDELLSDRMGEVAAARKCRDRAIALMKSDRLVLAIRQLQNAKIKWFTVESLEQSVLATLVISDCYRKLGLLFAAKYYSMATAFLTMNVSKPDLTPYASRALLIAAECDYGLGSWIGFLILTQLGLTLHGYYRDASFDLDEYEELRRVIFHFIMQRIITERLNPDLLDYINDKIEDWISDDFVGDLLSMAQDKWENVSEEEIWDRIEKTMLGVPYADLQETRDVEWSAIGVDWIVRWNNDYSTTPVVEQFIAVLQIVIADLAGKDLCLLKTSIDIEIEVTDSGDFEIEPIQSNEGSKWRIVFPIENNSKSIENKANLQNHAIVASYMIIADISLLPTSEFNKAIEGSFRDGLLMKALVGQPYAMIYLYFIKEQEYNKAMQFRNARLSNTRQNTLESHEELKWIDSLGPGYSKETAIAHLQNRYDRLLPVTQQIMKNLTKKRELIESVSKIRLRGWLDWQIMGGIHAMIVNYNVQIILDERKRKGETIDENIFKDEIQKLMSLKPEIVEELRVPEDIFTESNIGSQMLINMTQTLHILGLECKQMVPDFQAIGNFLRIRYNFMSDDIEHEDPFSL